MTALGEICPGSRWVLGAHGIGLVQEVTTDGVLLRLPSNKATVRLPLHTAAQRLRRPMVTREARGLLKVLRAPSAPPSREAWSRRLKIYRERLNVGLPDELAAIYRDLGRRKYLSPAELQIFRATQALLAGELSLLWPDAAQRIKVTAGSLR